MALTDTTKFEKCVKLATEAKELRDKAQATEKEAVEGFRQVREESLTILKNNEKKINKELKDLKTEYTNLATIFCKQKNHNNFLKNQWNK